MYFIVPIFIFLIASQISSLGALVYTSINSFGLSSTAQMALTQAMAAVGALFVSEFLIKRSLKNPSRFILFLNLIFCILNFAYTFFTSEISSVLFFSRLMLGGLLTGLALSQGPRFIDENNIPRGNQILQIWSSISALIGFGIAPILASSIKIIFTIDLILNTISFVIIISLLFKNKIDINKLTSSFPTPKISSDFSIYKFTHPLNKQIMLVSFLTFILWCFGGFFHVTEVPMLVHKFHLQQNQISLIFILTLILNVMTVALFKSSFVSKNSWFILVTSLLLGSTACIVYTFTDSIIIVLGIVSLIGATNGAFNFSQATIIQTIPSNETRLKSIIFIKFISQIGLMTGALFAGSGFVVKINDNEFLSSKNNKIKIEKAEILLQNLPREFEPYKHTDTGSMLVIHQVFDNLFEYDSRNNLNPKIVETLIWENENKKLKLILRKNLHFSDGSALTAHDAYNSLMESKKYLGSSADWAFGSIKNINLIDDHQIEFEFKGSFTLMPAILASPYFGVFKKNSEGKIIGSGHYKILSNDTHTITLIRNKYTTEESTNSPQEIRFHDLFDTKIEYLISDLNINNKIYNSKDKLIPIEFKTLQIILFIPNLKDQFLKNHDKRCQLMEKLSDLAIRSYPKWKPAEIGLPFYTDFIQKKESFYKKVNNYENSKIKIFFPNSTAKFEDNSNNEITSQLKPFGYNVQFEQLPIRELIRKAKSADFSGLMIGFIPDFVHPHAVIYPLLGSKQAYNFGSYSNSIVDKMMNEAVTKKNKEDQNLIYTKIIKSIKDDCAISFLGSQPGLIYMNPKLDVPDFGQLGLHNVNLSTLKLKDQ